jgi:hypothetical protein
MIDLSAEELDRLYEGSKNDHYIIVGSEVRQMIGMIRRRDERIAGLEATLEEIIYRAKIFLAPEPDASRHQERDQHQQD